MYAYVQAFLEQVLVSVACNGAHTLKERLARWLLMMGIAATMTHWRLRKTFSAKRWVFRDHPLRIPLGNWNEQV